VYQNAPLLAAFSPIGNSITERVGRLDQRLDHLYGSDVIRGAEEV
jgi:hypothetical protein